jgi:hypothetical protein
MGRDGVALSIAALTFCIAVPAHGQDAGAVNDANNPLTPKTTINLQNYFTPSFYGAPDTDANNFLLRGLIPLAIGGPPNLLRFTLPLTTVPTFGNAHETGLGDLTLMDLFVFPGKPLSFALGPILVAPTATSRATGDGRWQAGAAGLAIAPQTWGLLGALLTYQHSFADSFDREPQSALTFQPIANYNLAQGFYLRSTAIWNFDLENHVGFIPVGFGIGKVIPISNKVTANAYIEPQYTVYHYGDPTPRWQIFCGVNIQF